MRIIPSRRLVSWLVAGTIAALAVLAFPSLWLLLLAFNLVLAGAALLDWWITPGPQVLEVVRTVPERMAVLTEHAVLIRVRNHSPYSLWSVSSHSVELDYNHWPTAALPTWYPVLATMLQP